LLGIKKAALFMALSSMRNEIRALEAAYIRAFNNME